MFMGRQSELAELNDVVVMSCLQIRIRSMFYIQSQVFQQRLRLLLRKILV